MAASTFNNVRLGLFVTLGIGLFIVAVYFIGAKQNMFGATVQISAVFGNVGGLQKGNNVRYSGITVGTVNDIVFLNDSTIKVDMAINRKVQPFLKKDAIASIGSDGLVGSMLINISPGNGKSRSVEDGDILATYSRIKPEEMFNTLGNTNETVALIANNLLRLTEQINEGPGAVTLLLNDSLLAVDLYQSVHNLRLTSGYLAQTGRQLEQLLTGIREGRGSLGQLLGDTTLIADLRSATAGIDTLINAQAPPVLEELNGASRDIAAAAAALKAITDQVQTGKGPVGTLLYDPETSGDIRQILQNLNEASARLNENMEAMRHNFLFRGYFKKLEKENTKKAKEPGT